MYSNILHLDPEDARTDGLRGVCIHRDLVRGPAGDVMGRAITKMTMYSVWKVTAAGNMTLERTRPQEAGTAVAPSQRKRLGLREVKHLVLDPVSGRRAKIWTWGYATPQALLLTSVVPFPCESSRQDRSSLGSSRAEPRHGGGSPVDRHPPRWPGAWGLPLHLDLGV